VRAKRTEVARVGARLAREGADRPASPFRQDLHLSAVPRLDDRCPLRRRAQRRDELFGGPREAERYGRGPGPRGFVAGHFERTYAHATVAGRDTLDGERGGHARGGGLIGAPDPHASETLVRRPVAEHVHEEQKSVIMGTGRRVTDRRPLAGGTLARVEVEQLARPATRTREKALEQSIELGVPAVGDGDSPYLPLDALQQAVDRDPLLGQCRDVIQNEQPNVAESDIPGPHGREEVRGCRHEHAPGGHGGALRAVPRAPEHGLPTTCVSEAFYRAGEPSPPVRRRDQDERPSLFVVGEVLDRRRGVKAAEPGSFRGDESEVVAAVHPCGERIDALGYALLWRSRLDQAADRRELTAVCHGVLDSEVRGLGSPLRVPKTEPEDDG
jgi:hypothetical protein